MLSGKTAVVTGSTSGIGLGIAENLAASGANIVLNGFGDPKTIEETRAQLARDRNVGVIYSAADMSRPTEIEAMMALAAKELGRVDILVNNAGIQHVDPIEDFPTDKWDAIIAITLSAAFHATRLVVPSMKQQNWGRIINIASAHALVASPFKSAYVAAKHGVAGLTKTVALEVATHGITVNAVCPGYVLTPLVEHQIPEQGARHLRGGSRPRCAARRAADQALHHGAGGRRPCLLPVQRRRQIDHRRHSPHRRRLDRALERKRFRSNGFFVFA